MSRVSINKGNLAKNEIDKAINSYNKAIDEISKNNNNSRTDEIISLIKQNREELVELKKNLDNINSRISSKLNSLDKEKEKEE